MNNTSNGEAVLFWILAPITVMAALAIVGSKKAVHSALWMAVVMVNLAMFFAVQSAPFLAVAQVVVYTGAVMMLFLFVLMLIGVDSSDSLVETIRGQRIAAMAAGVGFGVVLIFGIGDASVDNFNGLEAANNAQGGNVEGLASLIFTKYVFAFEVIGALLITAALGAMVLAHREQLGERLTQKEMSIKRFKDGGLVTQLPPPGVYARSNAVDMPALLPDGTASELSTSRVLRDRGDVREPDISVAAESEQRAQLGEGHFWGDELVNPANYLYLSAMLFTIGAAGVLIRRNAIVVFMCVELMLNAANLAFVTFARQHGTLEGQIIALFVMVVAAAEVVVGLAIIVTMQRTRRSASVDDANLLKY